MLRIRTLTVLTAAVTTLFIAFAVTNTWAAASEKVLYSFSPQTKDGFYPYSNLVSDSAGNLYGTTQEGGAYSAGSVFEVSPSGKSGWTEKVLYSFARNGSDGYFALAGVIFDSEGNLYGTTESGGAYGDGTVFELFPNASGTWTEKVLHSFDGNGTDGYLPYAGLTLNKGNLYGTTILGGPDGLGTVFELSPSESGAWTETILYSFPGSFSGTDGLLPLGGVIFDTEGNLYGTTFQGGTYEQGTVFELSPVGNGSWTETILYNFGSTPGDGLLPYAGLVLDTKGNLYGTTTEGGGVFEVSPNGRGGWTETTLYDFGSSPGDGFYPYAGLIIDSAGNLYGTTVDGGAKGAGTVFELIPELGGSWREEVLHSFKISATDGSAPYGGLLFDSKGNLYGTTIDDGAYYSGTVFEMFQSAGVWKEKLLHSFNSAGVDGEHPLGSVTFDAKGNLYGATSISGTSGFGTVFELSPKKTGGWTENTLLDFDNKDGAGAFGGLIFDSAGSLYGATSAGGTHYAYGTLFELSPETGGSWTEKVLKDFAPGDGPSSPEYENLIFDAKGNLYGTTLGGGTHKAGTVFELAPNGTGGWTETVLHDFALNGTDGTYPSGSLIFDSKGNLYGTTQSGGTYYEGTVFELSPNGKGGWTETVLHDFGSGPGDGANPYSGLIFDAHGNLYGTTYYGGDDGVGAVFELSPNVNGAWAETLLYSFNFNLSPPDGENPNAALILNAGNLYGTTIEGGSGGAGTVFELSPNGSGGWTETILHNFLNNAADGQNPYASLILDAKGNLYGTTENGGPDGAGTVFEITP